LAKTAAAAQLGGHLVPLYVYTQHEQDPGQGEATGMRGRPPFDFTRPGGRKGLIVSQRSSGTGNTSAQFCRQFQGRLVGFG
jgi:hypothetical protein